MESVRDLSHVRGGGFLFNDEFRMGFEKVFVVKRDMPDDTQPVCDNAELKGIAETTIDVHLLYGRISGGMGRHGGVSRPVGIIGIRKPFCLLKA